LRGSDLEVQDRLLVVLEVINLLLKGEEDAALGQLALIKQKVLREAVGEQFLAFAEAPKADADAAGFQRGKAELFKD